MDWRFDYWPIGQLIKQKNELISFIWLAKKNNSFSLTFSSSKEWSHSKWIDVYYGDITRHLREYLYCPYLHRFYISSLVSTLPNKRIGKESKNISCRNRFNLGRLVKIVDVLLLSLSIYLFCWIAAMS